MMVGDVQHPGLGTMIVIAHEIEIGMMCHVGSGDRNILITADIRAWRVIDLVISSGGDRKAGDIPFAVIHDCMDIGRKNGLIVVMHMYSRVGPPQKCLRLGRAVVKLDANLQIGAPRI